MKYVTEKGIINLASAIAVVVRSMLETILESEKSLAMNQLRLIRRLIVRVPKRFRGNFYFLRKHHKLMRLGELAK